MDSSSKRTSIAEALAIFKKKRIVKEEHYSFVQRYLMKCEEKIEERNRNMEKTYNRIIKEHLKYYKDDHNLLSKRIE
ncbi:hypothetical protein P3S67_029293 [Capsicum chacoense]